jgi:hypothetical protein
MRRPALLFFVAANALLNLPATPTQAAYAYYGVWRQCWVTETGLGVCAPVRAHDVAPHRRQVGGRRR